MNALFVLAQLDQKYYMQIRYKTVLSIAQTDRKSMFFCNFVFFSRTDLRSAQFLVVVVIMLLLQLLVVVVVVCSCCCYSCCYSYYSMLL